jgi:UDP-glucose 4-epimerase
MSKILVTGGCGYIGSHTIIDLIDHGYEVISVDNLVNSSLKSLDRIEQITGVKPINYNLDLSNSNEVEIIFKDHPDLSGIIHFAALKAVGESTQYPLRYFKNNIGSLINTLDCAYKYGVTKFIFSSSCTVYGNTSELPVTENTPLQKPSSPYGQTKQICETILDDTFRYKGGQIVILRYFNPAGAHPSHLIGEESKLAAQNLVPIITETSIGKRDQLQVYGSDYDTRDGTCIRDYIHIMDLAHAHTRALEHLFQKDKHDYFDVFNLGIGSGVSVLEMIKAFEKVSGQKLNYKLAPRRKGDVVAIYSDYTKAKETLAWIPKYTIEDIMHSAWAWENHR